MQLVVCDSITTGTGPLDLDPKPCHTTRVNNTRGHLMIYRVIIPSARYEDQTTNDLDQARDWCYDMAQEFGYAEIRRNLCGPEPIIESYCAS